MKKIKFYLGIAGEFGEWECYLHINYSSDRIALCEMFFEPTTANEELNQYEAPSSYSSDWVNAQVSSHSKKQFFWLINNIIDIIKSYQENKEDVEIRSPRDCDDPSDYRYLYLSINTYGLLIKEVYMRNGHYYCEGILPVSDSTQKKLKNAMFKIKKEIKK